LEGGAGKENNSLTGLIDGWMRSGNTIRKARGNQIDICLHLKERGAADQHERGRTLPSIQGGKGKKISVTTLLKIRAEKNGARVVIQQTRVGRRERQSVKRGLDHIDEGLSYYPLGKVLE